MLTSFLQRRFDGYHHVIYPTSVPFTFKIQENDRNGSLKSYKIDDWPSDRIVCYWEGPERVEVVRNFETFQRPPIIF
jgi:hypothetical protein